MGNDGGSIPGRSELVRPKQKEVRVESDLVKRERAKFCALTKERLKKPVAACRVGYLFNYESLLKAFMDKSIPQEFNHIKKLKHVKQLNLQENVDETSDFPFMCSVSQNVMNGKNRFIALWSCGCVFDEKVIKEFGIKNRKCPICNKQYDQNDLVHLAVTNEEAEYKRAQLLEEQVEEETKKAKQFNEGEDNFEKPISKKVCTAEKKKNQQLQQQQQQQQVITKIVANKGGDEDNYKNSETYQSLFHKKYDLESNLFARNVRYGIR